MTDEPAPIAAADRCKMTSALHEAMDACRIIDAAVKKGLLCAVAAEGNMMQGNPSDGIKKVRVEAEGHIRWTDDDIAAFRNRWPVGTTARACFELVLWTGARTNDAVKLGRQHIGRDGVLVYRQGKTANPAHVPWTAPLPEFAAGWWQDRDMRHEALRRLSGGMTFLEAHGRARSIKGLGNVINDGAREAGLTGRTAHGLRKARLSLIAENGGTSHAIMAWGGHVTLSEAEHYTRSASLRRLVTGTERDENAVNGAPLAVNGSATV